MKTAKEWFKELPEQQERLACINAENEGLLNAECGALYDAILSSFDWSKTPEGVDYWRSVCNKAYEEEKQTRQRPS